MQLRDYQYDLSIQASERLDRLGMVYLSMEVRTGKTLTSIAAAEAICKKHDMEGKIAFLTKKKAIKDIMSQYEAFAPQIEECIVINYESVHTISEHLENIDVLILDEAHGLGAYPKMTAKAKKVKAILDMKSNKGTKVILLSGTPSPESYSQLFHQFQVSKQYSPFREFGSFYKWAAKFVNVKQKYVAHGNQVNDYSDANKTLIDSYIQDYFISYTQEDAGFSIEVKEEVLEVEMRPITYHLVKRLLRDLVVEGNKQTIVADTGVKLQSKVHQLCSGTIKFDDGSYVMIDDSKAKFIRDRFKGKRIAVFYKFIAEGDLLREIFPNNTSDQVEFRDSSDSTFIGQIQSVREGHDLSCADCLVMYNIDFSAVSYWQGRDRLSTKDRTKENKVYWIFAKGGIEQKIYKKVQSKKDYTLSWFVKEYNVDKKRFKKDEI